jgi:hypothetical protein
MNFIRTSLSLRSALTATGLAVIASCASTERNVAATDRAITVHGYVLDSACAFIKDLAQPISKECAIQCANAGSPLVILADDGMIYWPISSQMPAVGMNQRLMDFAGDRVVVTGKEYMKGGACGFVIETIAHEARAGT